MSAALEVAGVVKRFPWRDRTLRRRYVTAVDRVSFTLPAGGGLGIVGESGCGKSTLARTVLRLIEPDEGTVHLAGRDVLALRGKALRRCRRDAQLVFQDAAAALDPRLRVGAQIAEAITGGGWLPVADPSDEVRALLDRVGLARPLSGRYPHQLSGGQRQRVAIARALATTPRLLVLDEPVSSLDVSVQARVLALLRSLRDDGLAMIMISHDLAVMGPLVDRVAVMYFGRLIEIGRRERVLRSPRHPYTASLLAAVPRRDPGQGLPAAPVGEVPSLLAPPSGCPFHPRCRNASDRCRSERPELEEDAQHAVACHHPLAT